MVPLAPSASLNRSYWLAHRGVQQRDLAERFSQASEALGVKVLALKGIAIADELYGGFENRPMADLDLLVVDTKRFAAAAGVARSLGLVETGASDHALVFVEPASRVVLELHISLTSCPGLFLIDYEGLWARRLPVYSSPLFRLGNADMAVHLALHTAFQHGFAANLYHYQDFALTLEVLRPQAEEVVARAREWGALKVLAAMAVAAARRDPESRALSDLAAQTAEWCPGRLRRWIEDASEMPPPFSVSDLARVRYELAPSKIEYAVQSLAPRPIPGRTTPRPGGMRRLASILDSWRVSATSAAGPGA